MVITITFTFQLATRAKMEWEHFEVLVCAMSPSVWYRESANNKRYL